MPLETSFNSIADLNVNWPTGPDLVNKGDDHIRGVKQALKNTFPQIDKPLTITADGLNAMAASVDATGAQITMKKPVDMGNARVMSVAAPTSDADAANKKFVADADAAVKAYALAEANQARDAATSEAAADATAKINAHKAAADQHPISGVTGLQTALTAIGQHIDTANSDIAAERAARIAADNTKFDKTGGTVNGAIHSTGAMTTDGNVAGKNGEFGAAGENVEHYVAVWGKQDYTESNGVHWRLGARLKGWWENNETNNCGFTLYWRDRVGVDSDTVFEMWSYGVRKDWGCHWGSGRLFSGAGTVAYEGSDQRLKHDIVDNAAGAMERICALRTVQYVWNDSVNNSGRVNRGFIAQQAAEVDAEHYTFSEYNSNHPDLEGGFMHVDSRAIIADLVDCIKELRHEIAQLRADAGL